MLPKFNVKFWQLQDNKVYIESWKIMCTLKQNQIYICSFLSTRLVLPHLN